MGSLTVESKEVNGLCDVAVQYLQKGLSVIPTRRKRPVLQSWRKYQDRLPTELEWELWCPLEFDGVALVLGEATWERWPHLWVLDVEAPHRPQAEAWLKDVIDRTAIAESISGGLHVYFTAPRPVQSTRFAWGDVLGRGRIVNLPPSGWGGREYRWLRPLEKPEQLLCVPPEDLNLPGFRPPATEERDYTAILLRQRVPQGRRNVTLVSFLGFLWQSTPLTPDDIWRLALYVNGRYFDPPLPLREVRDTWRSVVRYPRTPSPRPIKPGVKNLLDNLLREAGIRTTYDTPPILTFEGPSSASLKPCVWLGDVPLFPGELVVIGGEPGSGKTTFVLRALPEDALLMETDFGPEVFGAMRAALGVTTRVHFMNPSTPAHVVESLDRVKGLNVSLVCIDTLQGITAIPEELDRLVAALYRYAQETGIPVVVISHVNRRQDTSPLHRIQGTLRLAQQATLVIEIRGWGKRPREARVLKDRYGFFRAIPDRWPIPEPGPHRPLDRNVERKSSSVSKQSAPPKPKPSPSPCLGRILALLRARGPMSATDIAHALGYSRQYVYKLLKELERAGEIQIARPGSRGRGHTTLYAAKMSLPHGHVNSGESTPQESATDKAKVHELHFMSAMEADLRPKMQLDPQNATEAGVAFYRLHQCGFAPENATAAVYIRENTRDPAMGSPKGGQGRGRGLEWDVSQGMSETRPEPGSGSGTVEPPNGSTGDIHACPPEPADPCPCQPSPPPAALTQETDGKDEFRVTEDDFPVWAIWTIEMPNTRKGGACPFHDCPYHKPLTPKDPWSWLL